MSWTPDTSPVVHPQGRHKELVRDAAHYAHLAGVPIGALWVPMSEICSPQEVQWVKTFPKHEAKGIRGLIYTGPSSPALTHSQALAGALVRNFIDARLRTVDDVLAEPELPTVLVIPDLFWGIENPTPTRKQAMASLIMDLFSKGSRLVCYVSDLDQFGEAYGKTTQNLLADSCLTLDLGAV